MSLRCPNCDKGLPFHLVRGAFTCPSCGERLVAKTVGPMICALVLWSLVDVGLKAIVYSHLGHTWWPGIAVRIVVSGLIGWVLIWGIFAGFVNVERGPR